MQCDNIYCTDFCLLLEELYHRTVDVYKYYHIHNVRPIKKINLVAYGQTITCFEISVSASNVLFINYDLLMSLCLNWH